MTKHKVEIYWSQPDNAFIAEAPELPGCCADGPTRQEAVSNLETIIEEWIETAIEIGRHIPSPSDPAAKHQHQDRLRS
ncbi:MAG: type II toxin-antitoxin system HicB family antitoxin [Acidobacteria bacterium]|nr:type II toxin-antitoxin system HicB family antitoxin [Acidobacteriota bacterium]